MKSNSSDADQPQRSTRPFDAIVIALSSALLVIFGILIGRLVVTTQAVAVVDHYDGELAALQAEIVELNRQVVQSQARCTAAEESADQYRRLAQQHQIRAETLAAQQQSIRSTLASLAERREVWLQQVEHYVALNKPIPAMDVLRFAQSIFDMQTQTIDQLASETTTSPNLPTVPGFPPVAAVPPATASAGTLAPPPPTSAAAFPDLPAPQRALRAFHREESPAGGGFVAAPRRRQAVSGSMFFAARRNSKSLSMPAQTGITFHDTASSADATRRR